MFDDSIEMAERLGPENVFDFSLGNPSSPPPPQVRESIIKHLNDPDQVYVHGYMNNSGYPEVREKIADSLNRRFDAGLSAVNIIMSTGAAGGINAALNALIDPGDEIIVLAPFFGEYRSYAANVDAKLVVCPPLPPDFTPNFSALEALITDKTKVVIINSPNNPTGVIYPDSDIRKLSKLLTNAQSRNGSSIYIISDEPYRELVYTDNAAPWIPDFYGNTIVGNSFSKSLSLAGERIGYLVVPDGAIYSEDIIAALNVFTRTLGFVNAPSLMQLVAADCIDVPVEVSVYRKNRDELFNGLTEIGYKCVPPDGAFYLFVESPIADDLRFCEEAKEFGLSIVPGRVFGCEGYFRLAYCIPYDRIVRSLPKFRELYEKALLWR